MKIRLTICFLLLICSAGLAQKITITGVVTDKETSEPLPFASIGIKGKSIGTITNLQGEFDFHINPEYRNEILVISMLGYENFESPVWSLANNKSANIQLTKSTTVLDEVVILDTLKGGDILRIALNRIDQNYPMKPFMLEGFYRDIKRVAGTNISLLEAAVRIFDEDYAEPRNKVKLRERVRLLEVRKSAGYESKFTSYFDQDNLLEDLLLHNNIRYRQIDAKEELFNSITRLPDSYYNGHEIYVVAHSRDYLLKVLIDKQDYSIIRLEFEIGSSNEIVGKRKGLVSRFSRLSKTIDFREVDGKMYLSFMTINSKINWHDANTNEFKFETELFQQLLINEITPNTTERIGATEKMRNYGLQYQDRPYNHNFWNNYNVIKDTPLDKKILEDLEKAGALQKQFEGRAN